MASSSSANRGSVPVKEGLPTFYYYPQALARYQDVVACPQLFMDTLGKLHATMGTKFMIPIIGGKDLDLHRLFVEVTSRGGIKRVLAEKKWKEVTTSFSFPPSATNASFILRKYYLSLLHHYEQVYYFEARAWTPVSTDAWQNTVPNSIHAVDGPVQSSADIQVAPVTQQRLPSSESTTPAKRLRVNAIESLPGAILEPSVGCSVTGMIDGKFESGYLITVTVGSEQLRGVLYQIPQDAVCQMAHHQGLQSQYQNANRNISNNTSLSASGVTRRRRRKKSEMRKRDPAHPKPNRSGYNFFFAEQHARLKPLHPGRDRDISRMIGESWNNLKEAERAVYQEKALRDKERYRIEMLHYKESLGVRIISNTVQVPWQQPPNLDVEIGEVDENLGLEGGGSPENLENEPTYGRSDQSNSEDDDDTADNGVPMRIEAGVDTSGTEMQTVNKPLLLFEMNKECSESDTEIEAKEEIVFKLGKEKQSLNIQDEKSAGAGEEKTIQEELIVPIRDSNGRGGTEGGLSFEKESVEPIQLGIEGRELTAAILEKESVSPEDKAEKESVALPVKEKTETESASTKEKELVIPEDEMVKESRPTEEKGPVDPEERVENLNSMPPVQESMAANMTSVAKEAIPAEEGEKINSHQQGKGMLVKLHN